MLNRRRLRGDERRASKSPAKHEDSSPSSQYTTPSSGAEPFPKQKRLRRQNAQHALPNDLPELIAVIDNKIAKRVRRRRFIALGLLAALAVFGSLFAVVSGASPSITIMRWKS